MESLIKKISNFLSNKQRFLYIHYDSSTLGSLVSLEPLKTDPNIKKLSSKSETLWGFDVFYKVGDEKPAKNLFELFSNIINIYDTFEPPNKFSHSWKTIEVNLDLSTKDLDYNPGSIILNNFTDVLCCDEIALESANPEVKTFINTYIINNVAPLPVIVEPSVIVESKAHPIMMHVISNPLPIIDDVTNLPPELRNTKTNYFYEKELYVEIKSLQSHSEKYAAEKKFNVSNLINQLVEEYKESHLILRQLQDLTDREYLMYDNYNVFYIKYTAAERLYCDILQVLDLINSHENKCIENPILYTGTKLVMSPQLYDDNGIIIFMGRTINNSSVYIQKLSENYPTIKEKIIEAYKKIYAKHFSTNQYILAQLFLPKEYTDLQCIGKNNINGIDYDCLYTLNHNPPPESFCYFSYFGHYGYKILLDDIYISVLSILQSK
jgi:hypothetical protein